MGTLVFLPPVGVESETSWFLTHFIDQQPTPLVANKALCLSFGNVQNYLYRRGVAGVWNCIEIDGLYLKRN